MGLQEWLDQEVASGRRTKIESFTGKIMYEKANTDNNGNIVKDSIRNEGNQYQRQVVYYATGDDGTLNKNMIYVQRYTYGQDGYFIPKMWTSADLNRGDTWNLDKVG